MPFTLTNPLTHADRFLNVSLSLDATLMRHTKYTLTSSLAQRDPIRRAKPLVLVTQHPHSACQGSCFGPPRIWSYRQKAREWWERAEVCRWFRFIQKKTPSRAPRREPKRDKWEQLEDCPQTWAPPRPTQTRNQGAAVLTQRALDVLNNL